MRDVLALIDDAMIGPAAVETLALIGNEQAAAPLVPLRDDVLRLAGQGELPARNVANIGYALFTDHLLAVEMAGALLLVAAVGAVGIAGRKGAAA